MKFLKIPIGYSPKLYPKHKGPFYITELGPNFRYKLRSCADNSEVKCLINASRLRKYVNPEPVRRELEEQEGDPPPDEQSEDETHQLPIQVDERQDATAQVNGPQGHPVPAQNPPDQQGEHVTDNQPVHCDQDPCRILRSKTVNKERQYLVRYNILGNLQIT